MLRFMSGTLALAIAGASHLILIPIMAIYGVSICPVLNERGFGFGCRYAAVFVAFVLLLDAVLNGALWAAARHWAGEQPLRVSRLRYYPLTTLVVHWAAFAVGTYFLLGYLRSIRAPGKTLTQMTVAFFYTALLLGVLQADILDWLTSSWLREKLARLPWGSDADAARAPSRAGLTASWLYGRVWTGLPFVVFVVISSTVIARKFMDIVDMDADELNAGMIHGILYQLSQVVGFLLVWLILVRLFTMLKEKQLVQDVHNHLKALGKLDAAYHSPTVASGYWETIFSGLNQTSDIIGQRARLIKGFSSYVTGSVVEKVLSNQVLRPEGETRELTIISSDLRNFTGISNSLPAEKVVQMLNVYFADMTEVLTTHGVTLDKFIGDGILAYVEPVPGAAAAPERAVAAAIAMHERVVVTNQKLRALGLPEVKIGVGVHAGSVILGSIGSPDKMQHTMIGDSVNIASRLEPLCKNLCVGIVVSNDVYLRLSPELQKRLQPGGEHEIRGVRAPVAIHTWPGASGESAA